MYASYDITNRNHHNGEKFKEILSLLILIKNLQQIKDYSIK